MGCVKGGLITETEILLLTLIKYFSENGNFNGFDILFAYDSANVKNRLKNGYISLGYKNYTVNGEELITTAEGATRHTGKFPVAAEIELIIRVNRDNGSLMVYSTVDKLTELILSDKFPLKYINFKVKPVRYNQSLDLIECKTYLAVESVLNK